MRREDERGKLIALGKYWCGTCKTVKKLESFARNR